MMGLFSNKRGMAGVFISFLLIALLALFAAKGYQNYVMPYVRYALFASLFALAAWLFLAIREWRRRSYKRNYYALFAPLTLILLLAASPFLPPPAVKAKAPEPGAVQAPVEEEGSVDEWNKTIKLSSDNFYKTILEISKDTKKYEGWTTQMVEFLIMSHFLFFI